MVAKQARGLDNSENWKACPRRDANKIPVWEILHLANLPPCTFKTFLWCKCTRGNFLDTSIEYLKGVGPQRAELLKKELQIFTFQDLLFHFPFRHIDRTKFQKISEINQNLT